MNLIIKGPAPDWRGTFFVSLYGAKELAEKLSVSDRTVSIWERGAGFPDISLVEPLADGLGLSVPELLHGEESPEAPPESNTSARETLRVLWPEVGLLTPFHSP